MYALGDTDDTIVCFLFSNFVFIASFCFRDDRSISHLRKNVWWIDNLFHLQKKLHINTEKGNSGKWYEPKKQFFLVYNFWMRHHDVLIIPIKYKTFFQKSSILKQDNLFEAYI